MPVCPHTQCLCGHKNVTAEVLINHVQSSPWAALYFCGICRCVCRSESALILVSTSPSALLSLALNMVPQHKQKVHKTSFTAVPSQPSRVASSLHSCRICDRVYTTPNALEQHYRDTPVHPKCTRCNIGFADNAAIQAVSSYLMLIPLTLVNARKARDLNSSSNSLQHL